MDVAQIRCALDGPNREALQHIFRLFSTPQSSLQKRQDVPVSLDESPPHGRVHRLGRGLSTSVRFLIIMIIVPLCHNPLTNLPQFKGRHGAPPLTEVIELDPDGWAARKCCRERIEYSCFAVISKETIESDLNLEHAQWFDRVHQKGRP